MSRSVVVTGGASGIGRATVARFCESGDRVTAVGRNGAALERLTADLHSGVAEPVRTLVCDVSDEAAVAAAFAAIGEIDVLVNNAGIGESAPLARTTLESWNRHLEVNATGAFLCSREALRTMRDGAIVTVASTASRVGAPYTAAYSASKHAALGLTRVIAAEAMASGNRANAVCPTFVETPLTERSIEAIVAATGRDASASRDALAQSSPLGRLLEPAEVAAAIFWLAGADARSINGQSLVLDGGGIQA